MRAVPNRIEGGQHGTGRKKVSDLIARPAYRECPLLSEDSIDCRLVNDNYSGRSVRYQSCAEYAAVNAICRDTHEPVGDVAQMQRRA